MPAEQIDNDIAAAVAARVRATAAGDPGAFQRCFVEAVESAGPTREESWRRFYENTLRALRSDPPRRGHGPIATFTRIYRRAEELIVGDAVLDVGTCFAFFPLLLSEREARSVTASDVDPGTVALARRMASGLRRPVRFTRADVMVPLPFAPRTFDTVTALHLLEHLPAERASSVLAGLCRVARHRVVIAVPLEDEPDPAYGHLQAFDLDALSALAGLVPGWSGSAHEYEGGWLVLEPSWSVEACAAPGSVRDRPDALALPTAGAGGRPRRHGSGPTVRA